MSPSNSTTFNKSKVKNDGSTRGPYNEQKCPKWSDHGLFYHLWTLWLFTRGDLTSMIYPNLVFGVASILSVSALTDRKNQVILFCFWRTPPMFIWLWLSLLLVNIANQRLSSSITEDTISKPWRPLPSQRLGEHQAKTLLLIIIPIAFASSVYFGTAKHMLSIMASTWMYNDLEGAKEHFLIRNIIIALGMASRASGAMIIAGGGHSFSPFGYHWITLVSFFIATTMQVQGLSDHAGDARREHKTLPPEIYHIYPNCVVEVHSVCECDICGE